MARPTRSFEDRIARLVRFRYPLLFAAVLNGLFVVGIPISTPARSNKIAAAGSEAVAVDTVPEHAADHEVIATDSTTSEPQANGMETMATTVAERESNNGPPVDVDIPLPDSPDIQPAGHDLARDIARLAHAASIIETWYSTSPKPDPFAGWQDEVQPSPENRADTVASQPDTVEPSVNSETSREVVHTTRETGGSEFALSLANDTTTGLSVAFVVNGRVYVLEPGASVELRGTKAFEVAFDRGGDFGTERRELPRGSYVFQVTETGWKLLSPEESKSRSHSN